MYGGSGWIEGNRDSVFIKVAGFTIESSSSWDKLLRNFFT